VDILKGDTFADGQTLNGARLNKLVDDAVIAPEFISGKSTGTVTAAGQVVFLEQPSGVLKKATISAINQPTDVGVPRVVWLTATGTFTTASGCRALLVECIGGGGGGGGAQGGSLISSGGGGGGGGSYAAKYILGPLASYSFTIGGAGTRGSTANGPGGNGGDTIFGTVLAKGGVGGFGGVQRGTGNPNAIPSGQGGGSQSGSTGDVVVPGADGAWGINWSNLIAQGGRGAPPGGLFNSGGGQTTYSSTAGQTGPDAKGRGSGGSGACSKDGSGFQGGLGGAGLIKVTEIM
jgi:hypothetical protein